MKFITIILLAAAWLLSAGCGYTTDSLIREDIGSVYVGYFENKTRIHGLEVDLRRALEQEIKLHGGMRLAGREDADSIIEGELNTYRITSTTRSVDDETLMKRIRVGVTYRWIDGPSRREMVPSRDLNKNVMLAVGLQEAEAVRTFREVAQELVQSLEREW